MKTSSPPHRRTALCRRFVSPVLALLTFYGVTASHGQAALRTYRATWSGTAYGNNARAEALVVIDDDKLQNPGNSDNTFGAPGSAIVSFDITVSGASAGNGSWTTSDFVDYWLSSTAPLNLSADWVGQPQPPGGATWGEPATAGPHALVIYRNTPGAPHGTDWYELTTNHGTGPGDAMGLTSFAPYAFGGPGARFYLGDMVDLNLSVLIAGELAPQPGESVRMLGLPAGMSFDPATLKITGQALGLVGNAGVKIQLLQGARVLRTLVYNLLVEPYKFAGGFEVLLESPAVGFYNDDGITIPAVGNAAPFPATITVPPLDLPETVTALRVRIYGFNHAYPSDVDVFLVAPNGAVAVIMSDAGGGGGVADYADLVFEDSAAEPVPAGPSFTSGTYQPADYDTPAEALPPGAVGPLALNLNALLAGGLEGDWKLFVSDDFNPDGGSIDSWELEFVYSAPVPEGKIKVTVASPTKRNPNPAFTAVMHYRYEPRRITRGQIMLSGEAEQFVYVDFPATGTLPLAQYDFLLTEGSDVVYGAEVGSPSTARGFRLVRLGSNPGGNPALTMTLHPGYVPDIINTPGGLGHATATVNSRGLVPMRGLLGDAQPFTTSLCLSQTHQAVVWLTPYRDKLSYMGGIVTIPEGLGDLWVPWHGEPLALMPSDLKWHVMEDSRAKAYPEGFGPVDMAPIVGRWNPATKAEALALSLGLDFRNLFLVHFNDPQPGLPDTLNLRDNFSFLTQAPANAAPLTGRANGHNGTFAGNVRLQAPATRTLMKGVFIQERLFDGGAFIGGGFFKIPISGPGINRGSYQTEGFNLYNNLGP